MSRQSVSLTAIGGCILVVLGVIVAFSAPINATAAFYSYEDRSGTMHFVDDLSKIPKQYLKKTQVRKDAYDDLPAEERALLLEKEREKRAAEERLTTKVVISGRQVLVPVKLGYGSEETDVLLLLDTGASSSVITPEVAERLKIIEAENVHVGVVGGSVINAKKVVLSHMEVGPIKKTNQEAVIVVQHSAQSGDGLLGMSFLGGLKYTIDFKKQTINWIP